MTRVLFVLLAASLVIGCAHNRRGKKTVLARAAFDFQCPAEDIELDVLDDEGARDLASQMAASGCGYRAVYVFVPDTNTWVLNGGVREAKEDGEDIGEVSEAESGFVSPEPPEDEVPPEPDALVDVEVDSEPDASPFD